MTVRILRGDVRDRLQDLPDESVHCVVTSPPYWGLRDYGVEGQLGLEATPEAYIDAMVEVFRDVHRVLRSDGTLWLNIGDSYVSAPNGNHGNNTTGLTSAGRYQERAPRPHQSFRRNREPVGGDRHRAAPALKPKDLAGIPWMLAFALRAEGWYLRQDIIWHKPNPMPESVRDRCTKAHEYLFLLSKSQRYYYDADSIREDWTSGRDDMRENGLRTGLAYVEQKGPANNSAKRVKIPGGWDRGDGAHGTIHREGRTAAEYQDAEVKAGRNKRSVWSVNTEAFPDAHFATFPTKLIEPCILAGAPPGGMVLDPFGGSGTTGLVADRLHRDAVLIELNPDYADMAERRMRGATRPLPFFAEVGT